MKTPHKHAELIKAWADGAEIEFYSEPSKQWIFTAFPSWIPDYQFRIKPEPKPDVINEVSVYQNAFWTFESERKKDRTIRFQPVHLGEMRLTWDGETGKLKSAEVL